MAGLASCLECGQLVNVIHYGNRVDDLVVRDWPAGWANIDGALHELLGLQGVLAQGYAHGFRHACPPATGLIVPAEQEWMLTFGTDWALPCESEVAHA